MNAVLLENFAGHWSAGGLPVGRWFVTCTLVLEAALLFVAAQAGFLDGPRVMSNMATDSWLPHRFASLSDRLVTQSGVLLMGGGEPGHPALHRWSPRPAGHDVLASTSS